jgi:hypothetical protein
MMRYSPIFVFIALALAGVFAYEYTMLGFDRRATGEEFERRMVRDLVYFDRERSLEESLQNLWARYPRAPRAPMSPAAVSAYVKQLIERTHMP